MEIAFIVHGLFSSEKLEQDDPVAVNIRLLIEAGSPSIFRIDVADGAHDIGGGMGLGDT